MSGVLEKSMLLLIFVSHKYSSRCCEQLLQLTQLTEEDPATRNISPGICNSLSVGVIPGGKPLAPQSMRRVSSALEVEENKGPPADTLIDLKL